MVLPNFEENLQKYARLLISKGINVQDGHTVIINIDVDQAPLARLLTKEAYALGAEEVIVKWADDIVTREKYLHTPEERLTDIPQYRIDESEDMIERKASRLSVRSADPDALNGVDSSKLAAVMKANSKALMAQRIATQANKVSWTVATASGAAWAAKVFPELETEEEQVDALWNEIFKTCRVYEADPVQAWDEHEVRLRSKADVLNAEQFDSLHYTTPEGTDLIVGMPEKHIWDSAGAVNAQGEVFVANMPTEEVFSAPDGRRIDGVVKSTKPLSYSGNIIEGMTFTFKDGAVTEVSAEKGEEVLKHLVEDNDGARSLGEVALVPHKSPISQSGLVFFNTLFDENASNHLALGSAYAFSIEGGTEMTQEELAERGMNRSNVHVDFMIGSETMNIDGIRKDGTRMPIFRNGDWAF